MNELAPQTRKLSKPNVSLSTWIEPRGDGSSLMGALFNRLDGMYPNRWRSSFGSEAAIKNWQQAWAQAFVEDGVTPADIQRALKRCRNDFDWPPSLTEFLKACKSDVDPEEAFYEAVRNSTARGAGENPLYSHPAIFWAGVDFGSWDMRSAASYERVKPRWTRLLKARLESACEPVPIPRIALPAPGQTEIPRERMAAMLAEARKRLGKSSADTVGTFQKIA